MIYFIGFILGLICSFGQPPLSNTLASLCSLAMYFYFLENTNKSKTWLSFFFGYGYCIYSHHWLSESLLTYGDQLLWLFPFGVLLIPAFFALYFALAGFLIHKLAGRNIFVIALIWLAVEFIRSYAYIESPWLLVGYIWSDNLFIKQSASIFAIWGLSFLTIIWAGAIKEFFEKKNLSIICIALLSFIFCYAYGGWHLSSPLIPQNIKVRVIQSNIDQNISSRMNNRYNNLLKHINLSQNASVDYVIWPEGAIEYRIEPDLLDLLKRATPKDGALIFNSTRVQLNPIKHWNSLFLIDNDGKVIDFYDKSHLVALGEFIPFRSVLPFINKITPGETDYSPGKGIKVINTKFPFLPSICYEAAFPENSQQIFTWIVNLTNDGWFGTSIGPYQHLAIARFRSVEQGVPMVRAALTGVSAIIDSFGNINASVPLLKAGIIEDNLPGYISGFTYYHRYGNYMLILLLISVFGLDYYLRKYFLKSS
jgi:apolipoprotein N-acyltransferase